MPIINTRQLLIVEDAPQLRLVLSDSLRSNGYTVRLAQTLQKAKQLIYNHCFCVAVVDRLLPDGDGIDLLEELRDFSSETRVLMLSQRSAVEDRIEGLRRGAHDYLPKPFHMDELLLRVDRLERTHITGFDQSFLKGGVRFYDRSTEIQWNGLRMHLRPREYGVLSYLARHFGLVVPRPTLLQNMSPFSRDITESALDVCISRIRAAVRSFPLTIETVHKVGYQVRSSRYNMRCGNLSSKVGGPL